MNTLVTLDLDYWTMTAEFNQSHIQFMNEIISRTEKVRVIPLHHYIVTKRMIPQDTEHVINIDFHNDIIDYTDNEPINEGIWGNFMPKSVRKFTWVYPDRFECIKRRRGICYGRECVPEILHVKYKKICGIAKLKLPKVINKFVICISMNWANYDLAPYYKFLKERGFISS